MSSLQPDINCLVCFSPISSKSSGSDQFQEDSFDLLQNSLDIPHLGSILKFSLCCQKCIYNLVEMVDVMRGIDELQRKLCQLKKKFKIQLLNGHKCSQDPLGSAEGDGIVDIFAEDRTRLIQGISSPNQEIHTPEDPISETVKVELGEVGQSQSENLFDEDISEEKPSTSEERHLQDEMIIKSFQTKTGVNMKDCGVTLFRIEVPQGQDKSKITQSNESISGISDYRWPYPIPKTKHPYKRKIKVKRGPGRPRIHPPKVHICKKSTKLKKRVKFAKTPTPPPSPPPIPKEPGKSILDHSAFSNIIKKQVQGKTSQIGSFKIHYSRACSYCGERLVSTSLEYHMKKYHPEIPLESPCKDQPPPEFPSENRPSEDQPPFEPPVTSKSQIDQIDDEIGVPKSKEEEEVESQIRDQFKTLYLGKCVHCNEKITTDFAAHMKNVHPQIPYNPRRTHEVNTTIKCTFLHCKFTADKFTQLFKHEREVHPEARPWKCKKCNASFRSNFTLKSHKKMHTIRIRRKKLTCNICFKGFFYLEKHMKKYHPEIGPDSEYPQPTLEYTVKCKLCSFSTAFYQDLRIHEKEKHPGAKPYACKYCTEFFSTRDHLSAHVLGIHIPRFKCNFCPKTFYRKDLLTIHLKTHTQPKKVRQKCPQCDRTFRVSRFLREHIKMAHEGGGRLICEICGKIFKGKSRAANWMTYKQHVKHVHEGIDLRKYLCDECPKRFSNKKKLEYHIQAVHRGGTEKNFSCEKCGRRYAQLKTLQGHMNTHEGIRPFKCKTCQKGFYNKNTLRIHEKIHKINPNPFPCPYCGKVYQLKIYLYGHLYRTKTECSVKARQEGKGLGMKEFVRSKKKMN